MSSLVPLADLPLTFRPGQQTHLLPVRECGAAAVTITLGSRR